MVTIHLASYPGWYLNGTMLHKKEKNERIFTPVPNAVHSQPLAGLAQVFDLITLESFIL